LDKIVIGNWLVGRAVLIIESGPLRYWCYETFFKNSWKMPLSQWPNRTW